MRRMNAQHKSKCIRPGLPNRRMKGYDRLGFLINRKSAAVSNGRRTIRKTVYIHNCILSAPPVCFQVVHLNAERKDGKSGFHGVWGTERGDDVQDPDALGGFVRITTTSDCCKHWQSSFTA